MDNFILPTATTDLSTVLATTELFGGLAESVLRRFALELKSYTRQR